MKNKTGSQAAGSQAGWKRWIRLALLLLWMAVIFSFSAQNGTRSAANSLPLAELLQLPEWVIRKGAHMAEYNTRSSVGVSGYLFPVREKSGGVCLAVFRGICGVR